MLRPGAPARVRFIWHAQIGNGMAHPGQYHAGFPCDITPFSITYGHGIKCLAWVIGLQDSQSHSWSAGQVSPTRPSSSRTVSCMMAIFLTASASPGGGAGMASRAWASANAPDQ